MLLTVLLVVQPVVVGRLAYLISMLRWFNKRLPQAGEFRASEVRVVRVNTFPGDVDAAWSKCKDFSKYVRQRFTWDR